MPKQKQNFIEHNIVSTSVMCPSIIIIIYDNNNFAILVIVYGTTLSRHKWTVSTLQLVRISGD